MIQANAAVGSGASFGETLEDADPDLKQESSAGSAVTIESFGGAFALDDTEENACAIWFRLPAPSDC